MRELITIEIREFSNKPGVKKIAVENFLMSMGTDVLIVLGNLCLDARLYNWNKETIQAIMEGILLAMGSEDQ